MKVLLGLDGTENSLEVLSRTIERTNEAGDDLTVAILGHFEHKLDPEELYRRARDAIQDSDIEAPVRRISGDPGSRLVDIAETEDFDAIALNAGQQTLTGKFTPARVIEFVILNASVSVILVR